MPTNGERLRFSPERDWIITDSRALPAFIAFKKTKASNSCGSDRVVPPTTFGMKSFPLLLVLIAGCGVVRAQKPGQIPTPAPSPTPSLERRFLKKYPERPGLFLVIAS